MKYLVEINDKTSEGLKVLNFIKELKAPATSITFLKENSVVKSFKKLTRLDMITNDGIQPTDEQLDEYFDRPHSGVRYTLEESKKMCFEKLAESRTSRNKK